MLRTLRRVRQSAVGGAQAAIWAVDAAKSVRDGGAAHEFDSLAPGECPQIRVRDVGALLLDALEEIMDYEEPGIGGVRLLRLKAHPAAIGAAILLVFVVCAR